MLCEELEPREGVVTRLSEEEGVRTLPREKVPLGVDLLLLGVLPTEPGV